METLFQSSKKLFDSFVKQVAEELGLSEDTVYDIVQHQWKSAYTHLYTSRTLEISNLGTFSIRPKKVVKRIKELNAFIIADQKKASLLPEGDIKIPYLHKKIENAQAEIDYLKTKIDEEVIS